MQNTTNYDEKIKYRIKECENENFSYLNLSGLGLKMFPHNISKINDILNNVKYLFLDDNEITEIDYIYNFRKLEVLDVSNNKLTTINKIPNTLIELVCHNNELTNISCSVDCSLEKLNCSFNKLTILPYMKNLNCLLCNNNKLCEIVTYTNINKLICNDNPINNISYQPSVEYVDCSNTKIQGKLEMPTIKHLICNNTKLNDIGNLHNINSIEFIHSDIKNIPYITSLKDIFYNVDQNIFVHKKYEHCETISEHNKRHTIFK